MSYDHERRPRQRRTETSELGKHCFEARRLSNKFGNWAGADGRLIATLEAIAVESIHAGETPEQAAERGKQAWYAFRRMRGLPARNEPADPEDSRALVAAILAGVAGSRGLPHPERGAERERLDREWLKNALDLAACARPAGQLPTYERRDDF